MIALQLFQKYTVSYFSSKKKGNLARISSFKESIKKLINKAGFCQEIVYGNRTMVIERWSEWKASWNSCRITVNLCCIFKVLIKLFFYTSLFMLLYLFIDLTYHLIICEWYIRSIIGVCALECDEYIFSLTAVSRTV